MFELKTYLIYSERLILKLQLSENPDFFYKKCLFLFISRGVFELYKNISKVA